MRKEYRTTKNNESANIANDINHQSKDGKTPLMVAIESKNVRRSALRRPAVVLPLSMSTCHRSSRHTASHPRATPLLTQRLYS